MPFFKISIHASAKEATIKMETEYQKEDNFNPRLREGGDTNGETRIPVVTEFQSTPPRRRRHFENVIKSMKQNFNPRLREGGDNYLTFPETCVYNFNPRLREGGDHQKQFFLQSYLISIHASAKEATATYCNTPAIMCISSLNNFFVHHF